MEKRDIEHLARLSRIKLTEAEIDEFGSELSSIVEYVGAVSAIASDAAGTEPETGPRYNVFRLDEITNEPNEFTADILAEMPDTDGRYMKVKKILTTED